MFVATTFVVTTKGDEMSTTTYTETIEAKRERRAAWAYAELPEAGKPRAEVRLCSVLCYANATPPLW
jgi:hypothetical protein